MTAVLTMTVIFVVRGGGKSTDTATIDYEDHASGLDDPRTAADVAPSISPEDTLLAALPGDIEEQDLIIGKRESFYDAARRLGGSHRGIMSLVTASKSYRNLERVRPGDFFRVAVDTSGTIHRLRFDLQDNESYVVFERNDGGAYLAYPLTYPVKRRFCVVAGEVQESLFLSLQEHGAPTVLASKINDILGWEVDFRRDVRKGDTYRILYEEIHRDGEYVRCGPIIALEYVNRNHSHRGYRFENGKELAGYYDETGRNLEKQLKRAPLEYSRISSGFTSRRFHPIHKRWMPHYGIDYAAPLGTPVHAAGSGTVLAAYYKGGNGRFVRIQHTNSSYETYYLHLSRFGRGIRKGAKVRQGQVIGYVGSSGSSTGPHLDYRVKVDGRWQNPRRLKLPASDPVATEAMAGFQSRVALYDVTLFSTPAGSGLMVVDLVLHDADAAGALSDGELQDGQIVATGITARANSAP